MNDCPDLASLPPGDHTLRLRSSVDDTPQPFRLFIPPSRTDAGPPPLVVVLHGKGVNHHAWFERTTIKEEAAGHGYIVAAPNGRGPAYYDGPGESDVLDIIARVRRDLHISDDRVYLAGHSMGGWGTWHIGLRHPDLFASICPMSAPAPLELLPNALHLAPLIIHDAGDNVVPVAKSRRAADLLRSMAYHHQYTEETGYGHDSRMISASLPAMFRWFEGHPRVAAPPRIVYVLKAGESGAAYWLDVRATTESPREPSRVDAAIDGSRVTITTRNLDRITFHWDRAPISAAIPNQSRDRKGAGGLSCTPMSPAMPNQNRDRLPLMSRSDVKGEAAGGQSCAPYSSGVPTEIEVDGQRLPPVPDQSHTVLARSAPDSRWRWLSGG